MTGRVDKNRPGPWSGWEAVLGSWPGLFQASGATLSGATPPPHVHSIALCLSQILASQIPDSYKPGTGLGRCFTILLYLHLDPRSRKHDYFYFTDEETQAQKHQATPEMWLGIEASSESTSTSFHCPLKISRACQSALEHSGRGWVRGRLWRRCFIISLHPYLDPGSRKYTG